MVLKLLNIEAWFWNKNQRNGVERCQVSWCSSSAEFQAALFGRKFCVKCQINLNSAKAGPAKHVCHHGTWKNLSKNHACQLGCHPNICHEIFRASCSATNVLLCSSLLASQLCGGQTSRKTHLLYPVLSIKYPCSPINIYMDSNKTIVHSTVESTQVTSGHSCPLHLQIILCNTMKGSITFPSPVHLSIFLHSSPGSKVLVTSCQPDADRFMDQTLTIGSWQIWDTIRVYGVLMSDLCALSECAFYVLHPIFFLSTARNSNGSIQCKRFHITPLVDGSLPLFVGGNDTRFTHFDAIFPREFSSTQSSGLQKAN